MVTMASNLTLSDSTEMMKQRMAQLNQFRKTRHFCDVVLQIGTAEIHAHRSVLACASPYFFELFTTDESKKTAREDKVVYKLSGSFEQESLEKLVKFAYTGDLDVPARLVRHVYVAANKLRMEKVSRACGEFLIAQLTTENCLSTRTIPGIANDAVLVDKLDHFIQQQLDLVRVSKDTGGVSRLQVRVMQYSADDASITSHALCTLVLEWIRRQMEEEDITLESLKEKKHLLYLNIDNSLHDCSDIRTGDYQDSEMVQDYKKISRKLSKTSLKGTKKIVVGLHPAKPRMMLYSRSISDEEDAQDAEWKLIAHSEVTDRSFLSIVTLNGVVSVLSIMQVSQPPSPTLRTPHQSRPASVEKVDSYTLIPHMASSKCGCGVDNFNGTLLVSGGYDRVECLRDAEVYSPKDNTWTKFPDMRQGRGRFGLAVLDGIAYAIGGSDGTRELNSVEVLDADAKRWTNVAQMPLARSNAGVCSFNGKIYCVGGCYGHGGIKQCDVYEPQTNTWTTIASLNIGRYQAGVAALDGKVYAVGGYDVLNCLSSVEVLDTELNEWRMGAPIGTARRGHGLAAFKGKLFMVGGFDGKQSLCSTEIYDPDTNSWSPGPSMTTCRANVGVAVVDGKLYAVGGFSGKNFLNSIEYLDPETMEWTNFTPKPEGYKSRKTSKSLVNGAGAQADEESRSETQEDNSASELDTSIPEESIPEESEPSTCGDTPAVNGIRAMTTNVH